MGEKERFDESFQIMSPLALALTLILNYYIDKAHLFQN